MKQYLVGQDLTSLFVNGEFGTLLIRLLHDRVFHLSINTLVLVSSLYFDDRTAIRSTFLHLGVIHPAFLEDRFIVVHVGYKDHDDRGAGVNGGIAIRTTRAIIQGCHI